MLLRFGDRFINTDKIVSAQPERRDEPEGRWALILADGNAITVNDPTELLATAAGTLVPAPRFITLVEAYMPEAGDTEQPIVYRESAIVAFRILPWDRPPTPITAEGRHQAHEDLRIAVRDPNGRCTEQGAYPWDSLEAFKANCERLVADRHAKADAAGASS